MNENIDPTAPLPWNTPAFWTTVITAVIAQGIALLALFGKHVSLDPNSAQAVTFIGSIAQLIPGIVVFIYVHGRHKTAQARLYTAASEQAIAAEAMQGEFIQAAPVQPVQVHVHTSGVAGDGVTTIQSGTH